MDGVGFLWTTLREEYLQRCVPRRLRPTDRCQIPEKPSRKLLMTAVAFPSVEWFDVLGKLMGATAGRARADRGPSICVAQFTVFEATPDGGFAAHPGHLRGVLGPSTSRRSASRT